jgi:hypothetical protein
MFQSKISERLSQFFTDNSAGKVQVVTPKGLWIFPFKGMVCLNENEER